MTRPIALYGGSFNPPHVVHSFVCLYLLQTGCDQVWLIPTWQHAFSKALAPFDDRLEMCRRMARPLGDRVKVLDIERGRGGVSYTIDTVHALRQLHPDQPFHWVVGSDILGEIDRWKDADELRRVVTFRVLYRGGYPAEGTEVAFPTLSSTDIRARLADGGSVRGWLSDDVLEWVEQRGLYRRDAGPTLEP